MEVFKGRSIIDVHYGSGSDSNTSVGGDAQSTYLIIGQAVDSIYQAEFILIDSKTAYA